MHRHRLALLLLTLVACGDDDVGEPFCPAGSYFDGDVCVLDEDAGSTGDMGPCGDCGDEVCDEVTLSCVACLRDTDCTDGNRCDTDLADPSMNRCVACTSDAHCTDPAAAKCDTAAGTCTACDDSTQCEGTGQNVCSDGTCVQCSEDDESACGENVCDVSAETCTTTPAGMTGLCQPCVSDRQCSPGRVCVPMEFDETPLGSFCLWRQDATEGGGPMGDCLNARPYVAPAPETLTVSGESIAVCSLRQTTCDALVDFDALDCTTAFDSDETCGVEALDDGLCRMRSAAVNRCTIPCLSDDDCKPGSSCNLGETPNFCNF